ncbi:MAG: cellulase family glycosylhydrolase [Stomatobaculum sp.]|nr:cellulase family glycosylhydrolase [Stomatobaculum sp.]
MEPELFRDTDAEDETWLRRLLPAEELERRLKKHRDSWITEADFRWIAAQGMNLVRIPVPWFIFGDHPLEGSQNKNMADTPAASCVEYLDRAFLWAERTCLKVLIDLHTTPGNQNGYDNGGLVGVCRWHRDPEEVEYVLTVLQRLGERYGNREGLFGIEVLNEPISWIVYHTAPTTGRARNKEESRGSGHVPLKFLRSFYLEAYRRLREVMPEDKAVVFHDGFRLTAWNAFFRRSGMTNVFLDTHQYIWAMEMFLPVHRPFVYRLFLRHAERQIKKTQKAVPVLVGEWCICTRYASFFKNHRYAGKGTDILGTRLKELSELSAQLQEKAKRKRGIFRKLEQKEAEALQSVEQNVENFLKENVDQFLRKRKEALQEKQRERYREISEMELQAWDSAAGWIYWSYKLCGNRKIPAGESWKYGWDFRRCIKRNWLTQEVPEEETNA